MKSGKMTWQTDNLELQCDTSKVKRDEVTTDHDLGGKNFLDLKECILGWHTNT